MYVVAGYSLLPWAVTSSKIHTFMYTQTEAAMSAHPQTLCTRVFMNGNSQAVRIPQEFRLDSKQVEIHRNADGDLVIHPLPVTVENRGDALLQALAGFDPAFIEALEEDRRDPQPAQERELL